MKKLFLTSAAIALLAAGCGSKTVQRTEPAPVANPVSGQSAQVDPMAKGQASAATGQTSPNTGTSNAAIDASLKDVDANMTSLSADSTNMDSSLAEQQAP